MTSEEENALARLNEPGRPADPNPVSTGRFSSHPFPALTPPELGVVVPSPSTGAVEEALAALVAGVDYPN